MITRFALTGALLSLFVISAAAQPKLKVLPDPTLFTFTDRRP